MCAPARRFARRHARARRRVPRRARPPPRRRACRCSTPCCASNDAHRWWALRPARRTPGLVAGQDHRRAGPDVQAGDRCAAPVGGVELCRRLSEAGALGARLRPRGRAPGRRNSISAIALAPDAGAALDGADAARDSDRVAGIQDAYGGYRAFENARGDRARPERLSCAGAARGPADRLCHGRYRAHEAPADQIGHHHRRRARAWARRSPSVSCRRRRYRSRSAAATRRSLSAARDRLRRSISGEQKVLHRRADVTRPERGRRAGRFRARAPRRRSTFSSTMPAIYGPFGRDRGHRLGRLGGRRSSINLFGTVYACRAVMPHFRATALRQDHLASRAGGATAPHARHQRLRRLEGGGRPLRRDARRGDARTRDIDVNAIAPGALGTGDDSIN